MNPTVSFRLKFPLSTRKGKMNLEEMTTPNTQRKQIHLPRPDSGRKAPEKEKMSVTPFLRAQILLSFP